jgi:large repetitive protein
VKLNDTVADPASNTTWVVDDDRAQCPAATFGSIQTAVDFAAPWDTIVVCEGVYEESSTPVSGPGNPVSTSALNGLTITKPLKIKGAGADKVTILPKQSIDSLEGLKPYLRDGGGNVITVSRQSLGSTDTNEMFVDISGVTVTSGDTWAEAGIAYFGAAGRVSQSVVGPLRVATTADELAAHPHGWGIVKTGVVQGSGTGTVESELTVAGSVVTGYQSGGILFDGAKGPDGAAANTVRTGIEQHGYVSGTVVRGRPSSLFPQTGVKYTSGVNGFVRASRVTGNYYRPDPTRSYGLLLADAGTETGLSASGLSLTGNGWAAYNATADATTVRTDAPFAVTSSYFGPVAPVAGGPGDPSAGAEAISGSGSVTTASRVSTTPGSVPTTYAPVADEDPFAAIVDPFAGGELAVGESVSPLVRAGDDFAVRSVGLLVDGKPAGESATAPYAFTWTPDASYAGKEVTLSAVATDSSGQQVTSEPLTLSVSEEEVVVPPAPVKPTVSLAVTGRNTTRGTAVITATVNTPGTVRLSGTRVLSVTRTATRAGTVRLLLRATPAFQQLLTRRGTLLAPVRVTLTSADGTAMARRTVVLVKKR